MRNYIKIFALVALTTLLAACSHHSLYGKRPHIPRSLDEAIEYQAADPESAIVLATFEEVSETDVSIAEVIFLGKKQNPVTGVSFAGSPYDIRSESLRQLHETGKKIDQKLGKEPGRIIALGGFKVLSNKNWAYVKPGKYAIHKVISSSYMVADMRGWGRLDRQAYMVFDINPGEVVYLGHIRSNWVNETQISLSVEDRFDQLRAELPVELQSRVQKRIVKAPSVLRPEEVGELNLVNSF